jgi:hypothetical protein
MAIFKSTRKSSNSIQVRTTTITIPNLRGDAIWTKEKNTTLAKN